MFNDLICHTFSYINSPYIITTVSRKHNFDIAIILNRLRIITVIALTQTGTSYRVLVLTSPAKANTL